MDFSHLIADALEARGNAVLIIGRPSDAEQALILVANQTFAQLVERPADQLVDAPMGSLRDLAAEPSQWAALMEALRARAPLKLDMRLRAEGRERWFGLDLTFKADTPDAPGYGVVVGRDITQSLRRAAESSATQRLLASVFLRIGTPIAIVAGNGTIRMANPAFQQLLEYDSREIIGLNVAALTPPEDKAAAQAARTRQLQDGNSYEMTIDTLTKRGARVPVKLRSVLLSHADQRLRLVTLAPERRAAQDEGSATTPEPAPASPSEPAGHPQRSVGQVQAISLAAFRAAFKDAWESIALRAMLTAEHIIKRRLGTADVVTRSDDGFFVWFDSDDEERNAAILAGASREIRLRFLTDFSEHLASHVSAVMVGEEVFTTDARDPSTPPVPTPALLDRATVVRDRNAREARALLAELRDASAGEARRVVDRYSRPRPMVLTDFPQSIRQRLDALGAFLPQEPDEQADVDLLRLNLAIRALGQRRDSVIVPLAWSALSSANRRRNVDLRLSAIEGELRPNLIIAATGVPPQLSAKRWSDVIGPLRRRLGDVALVLSLVKGDLTAPLETLVADWPLSMLVLDGARPGSVDPQEYFDLIAMARRRSIPVLAQLAEASHLHDWRELGATMFAGPP